MSYDNHTYDIVGVGIGPFNLGLAALSDPLDELDVVFLDSADQFRWHPGMMIDGATIQVPFLADLVTMADPCSRFSFLAYLKQVGRLYPFYIRESFYPLRAEYDSYCRWVAGRLESLRWGRQVVSISWDDATEEYLVYAACTDSGEEETYRARHLVLGTGTEPFLPEPLTTVGGPIVHTADYLTERESLRAATSVTLIGSGQSAAEVYSELLEEVGPEFRLDWVTRSPRFFPMEYTKLTLEMTSPEYTDHFHGLPLELRDRLGREQRSLYKGISGDLIDAIYDRLYTKSLSGPLATTLLSDTELLSAVWDERAREYSLTFRHAQTGEISTRSTGALVLATGYRARIPAFLEPIRDRVNWDARGRLAVARDYSIDGGRIFVVGVEEHTHGLAAPDLGFGAWRNSSILASILGREVYPIERRIAFQHFGTPPSIHSTASASAGLAGQR